MDDLIRNANRVVVHKSDGQMIMSGRIKAGPYGPKIEVRSTSRHGSGWRMVPVSCFVESLGDILS